MIPDLQGAASTGRPPRTEPALPRLIACDIDGTLLDGSGHLRAPVRDAVELVVESGVQVVLATGRSPWAGVGEIAAALGLPGPHITMQGALYSVPATSVLHRVRPIPGELYLESLEAAADLGVEPIVSVLDGHRAAIGGPWAAETRPSFSVHRSFRAVASLRDVVDEQPMRVFLPTIPEEHEAVRASLARRFAGRATVGRSDTSGVELLAHETSKGEALAWLAGSLGLGLHEVAAIGDAWNDLEMLSVAGRSVALANAPSDVLAIADRIVPSSEEDGVLHAFSWLLPHLASRLASSAAIRAVRATGATSTTGGTETA